MPLLVGGAPPPAWQTQVKAFVRARYSHLAEAHAFPPGGAERARGAGYPAEWLGGLPDRLAGAYCGCGYALEGVDLAGVRLAVDLGCGAGLDARLAAGRLAAGGRVVALDLSPAMLRRVGEDGGAGSPRIRDAPGFPGAGEAILRVAGDIERLPLASGSADLVLANASLNLTLDKAAALAEAARILRPGGRLVARELVREGELPAEIAQDPTAWNASLGGVLEEAEWRRLAAGAGFSPVRISHHAPFSPVVAVRIEAVKAA